MVISKKTAIGGTVLGGGSIGAGVGISKMTEVLPINEELQSKIKQLTGKFSFDLTSDKCTNSFRVREINPENYRKSVRACSVSKSMIGVAKGLGLDVIGKKNKGNSGLAGGDNNKEEIKKVITEMESEGNRKDASKNIVSVAETTVINGCENPNNNRFDENTTTEQGHNFLIACTKDPWVEMITFKEPSLPIDSFVNYNQEESILKTTENMKGDVVLGTAKTEKRNEYLELDFGTNDTKMEGKIRSAGFKFKEEQEQSCKDALNQKFDGYGDKYKTAVKACAKSNNFKTRAKELGFNVIPDSVADDDWKGLGDFKKTSSEASSKYKVEEIVENIRDKFKEKIKTAIGSDGTPNGAGSTDHTKIKGHCDSKNKQITGTFANAEGQDYLKACTKNKSISKKFSETKEKAIDFGTGKYTETISS